MDGHDSSTGTLTGGRPAGFQVRRSEVSPGLAPALISPFPGFQLLASMSTPGR